MTGNKRYYAEVEIFESRVLNATSLTVTINNRLTDKKTNSFPKRFTGYFYMYTDESK